MANIAPDGKIDVRPIYNGEQKEIAFSFELPEENYGFDDVTFNSPVAVSGQIIRRASGKEKNEGYTELTLNVSADISTECARCLEPINEKLSYTRIYGLTQSKVSEDSEEYISTENGIFDALEAARTVFLLNVPMRFLCSEDCKGLCSTCGKNLNSGECGCNQKEVDPRLAVLKNLKFDN